MSAIETDTYNQIIKVLQIGAEMLGLQRSVGSVLATFYATDFESGEKLSAKDVSEATGLSRSMISMVLSQLESLDIIDTYLDGSRKGGGRRTMLFTLRVGIHQLLKMGIKKHLEQVQRILNDLETLKDNIDTDELPSRMVIDRVLGELVLFLEEPCSYR